MKPVGIPIFKENGNAIVHGKEYVPIERYEKAVTNYILIAFASFSIGAGIGMLFTRFLEGV